MSLPCKNLLLLPLENSKGDRASSRSAKHMPLMTFVIGGVQEMIKACWGAYETVQSPKPAFGKNIKEHGACDVWSQTAPRESVADIEVAERPVAC